MTTDNGIVAQVRERLQQGASEQGVLEQVVNHFQAQSGTIHWLSAEDGRLKISAHVGVPPFVMDKVADIPVGKGIAGLAAQERRPVTMCNIKTDDSGVVGAKAKTMGIEGAIAVPLLSKGELHGTLGIGKNAEYAWSEEEVRRLEEIASVLCAHQLPGASA